MDIKAIETEYKGYRFRSRLEARWAIFFDACNMEWEYEPEGYDCNGIKYLPDFLVHDVYYRRDYLIDLYIEVKGSLQDKDLRKIEAFGENVSPILVVGQIPYLECYKSVHTLDMGSHYTYGVNFVTNEKEDEIYNFCFIDGDCYGAEFELWKGKLGLVGADHRYDIEDFYDYKSQCGGNCIMEQYVNDQKPLAKALDLARQARFEHGETPEDIKQVMWDFYSHLE